MRYTIRPYRTGDAAAIADVFRRSVEGVGPKDYAPDQVVAWAGRAPEEAAVSKRCEDGRTVMVAADEADLPFAYIDLEADGHLDHLYCAPEGVGQGIASSLYEELEKMARAQGLGRIYVEASEAAKRFFLRHGFVVVERRDFEVAGVPMHNYGMKKKLR